MRFPGGFRGEQSDTTLINVQVMYETTKRKASRNPERNKLHLCSSGLLRETAEKLNNTIGNILKADNVFAEDPRLISSTQVKVTHQPHYLQLQSI